MGRKHCSCPGFTLIELLIVVAIIAILAAIAVPNFLEAQTRAKVSRAKADLKTIVTALEAYRVDNNGYPTYHYSDTSDLLLEFHIGGKVPGPAPGPDPDWKGMNPLTSPISYLSKMPSDPFMSHRFGGPDEIHEYLYVNWPHASKQVTAEPLHSMFLTAKELYGDYRLHSRGPDRKGPDSGIPYDPTNGSVSVGDVTYCPKGGMEHFIPWPN